jgi:ATP-dependent Clp protease ATP-binding subunit ClpC
MFEKFTDRARKVMAFANQQAQRSNHPYIDTEHVLFGLLKEGSGTGAAILKNRGVDIEAMLLEVEKFRSRPKIATKEQIPQAPHAKKVIEYAVEEARALNHDYVGTEHILLGLLRETEGVAAQVLMNLGLTLASTRRDVLEKSHKSLPETEKAD